jgi:hypothetical protein
MKIRRIAIAVGVALLLGMGGFVAGHHGAGAAPRPLAGDINWGDDGSPGGK